jgi:hypothetical protein
LEGLRLRARIVSGQAAKRPTRRAGRQGSRRRRSRCHRGGLEFVYGYGTLDRFSLVGHTQFFQTRLQLCF